MHATTCTIPLHHVLKRSPSRLDVLGITIIGRLDRSRYTEYIPLLGAFIFASDQFADAKNSITGWLGFLPSSRSRLLFYLDSSPAAIHNHCTVVTLEDILTTSETPTHGQIEMLQKQRFVLANILASSVIQPNPPTGCLRSFANATSSSSSLPHLTSLYSRIHT
ncbi:hypothetical protein K458DRAFT_384524 [Lentithecium fluviatile CBS 122367]|uniref:Uncharacterized protein n=1 Tax=Lentithecium fluviatile CBS 122367 TaxID=1168545 RepID=A0A6G1JDN7_9PLEO|nr:hypothetical protein K458DRAFT_384524 [Lentithecium fluviatile CBS 122367]